MIEILYEDNHLIAVNKRPSDLVQGDKTGDQPLVEKVKAYIKEKYNKPGEVFTGVIHRIDRPTSGVVVFAKTSKALARMNKLFQEKKVQKVYWAVVAPAPKQPEGKLVDFLVRNAKLNKSFAYPNPGKNGKRSELTYKVIGAGDNYSYLEIVPKTGRHHQIRVQLSHMGNPIKGDLKYGARRSNKDGSIHLHARSINFAHPVTKESITIVAPPPKEVIWEDVLAKQGA